MLANGTLKRRIKANLEPHYTQELLQALKEELISELVIVSAMVKGRKNAEKGKKDKFIKNFANFSQSRLVLIKRVIPKKSEEEKGDGYKPTH
ncbi:hypothetical protein G9A89_015224 [Geosiphon pyriformis]|nr:hypothetical protein G9A89_015224 [Geosiphon pyriformis]